MRNYVLNNSQMNIMKYLKDGKRILTVKILYKKLNTNFVPDGFKTDYEKYNLSVETDGKVNIEADFYPGVIRGLDTLSQLIDRNENVKNEYRIKYTPINIKDGPSYSYRGLMLDTSKEYYYPAAIKQMLDGMMLTRMNVFHWHFMDSDSMPMYLQSYPDMVNYTAFRPQQIYTPEMVKDIVKYAKIRGIKIIPELETPAKVNSLGHYPPLKQLIHCYKDNSDKSNRNGLPPNTIMDIENDKTFEFLNNLLKDIQKSFDPEIFHLGGDQSDSS